MSKSTGDAELEANSTRGLVRTAYALGKPTEGADWFKTLVRSGRANAGDWQQNGARMRDLQRPKEAAQSYQQAAALGGSWSNWCEAASEFSVVDDAQDSVLVTARKCVSEGAGKKDSEHDLAFAYIDMASVLSDRGVYQDALSDAREASALEPLNSIGFHW